MKKCSYCGKEYPDEATACSIDGQPLETIGAPAAPKAQPVTSAAKPPPAGRPVDPALMTRLRSIHLYLGCIFAPMLLLFAISGIWQTLGVGNSQILRVISSIHTQRGWKTPTPYLSSKLMRVFIVVMALAFVSTTILGIIMALKYGRSRKTAIYCLIFGVAFPLLLIVIRLL
jgi:hypothetical protein